MSQPPLCRNCRHFVPGDPPRCGRVPEWLIDPVLGTERDNPTANCSWQRSWSTFTAIWIGACGRDGRWFEPRGGE
jgi:hypothetical protein